MEKDKDYSRLSEIISDLKRKSTAEVSEAFELRNLPFTITFARMECFGGARYFIRHVNPDGTVGGFVEKTALATETTYVSPTALVLGKSNVTGYAKILDYAIVDGKAWVSEYAELHNFARATGNSWIMNHASLKDNAMISGNVWIRNDSVISGNTILSGDEKIG